MKTVNDAITSFNKLLPSTVGFERLFDVLDRTTDGLYHTSNLFPPANIVREQQNEYVVELAVAGYDLSEISAYIENNILTVKGEKTAEDNRTYIFKGIAGRSFARRFILPDSLVIKTAKLKNGILSISLENLIPSPSVKMIEIQGE